MRVLELASVFEKLAQNTVPFNGTELGREMTDQELARAIRLDLEAELDAINLYSNHLQATKNKKAIETLEHVIKEEKEHLKLFTDLLKELDPEQAEILADKSSEL
jgi:rubrerythrin